VPFPRSILGNSKEEYLKDFMLKFNKEKLTVESPNDQMVLSTLMHGVRADGLLMAEIAQKSMVLTFYQFLDKIEEYNQEEMIEALMRSQKEVDRAKCSSHKAALVSFVKKEEKSSKKSNKK
jgi:hypothetical protein